jgi:hypothetical protein
LKYKKSLFIHLDLFRSILNETYKPLKVFKGGMDFLMTLRFHIIKFKNSLKRKVMKKYILSIIFALFTFVGCSSEKDLQVDEMHDISKIQPPPPPPGTLSPGSAIIIAELVSYEKHEKGAVCNIKVKEVLGYGPATKPIAVGEEMTINISEKVVHDYQENKKELEKGAEMEIQVRQFDSRDAKTSWSATQIK